MLSVAVGAFALLSAPGATTGDGVSYDMTFVTMWVWWLAFALVPVAAVLTWWAAAGWKTYLAAGAALVLPHVLVAAVVVVGYQLSGWGSGLEIFAFLHPLGLFVLALLVLSVVGGVSEARRRLTRGAGTA